MILTRSKGFGYHGDFMSGWDTDFLQEAIDTCTNESGRLEDCGLFVNNGPLLTEDEQNTCKFDVPASLASEDGAALNLKNLPGNIQIQAGPQSATQGGDVDSAVSAATSWLGGLFGGDSATTSATVASSSASSAPLPTSTSVSLAATPLGGAFLESSSASPSSAAVSSQNFNALAVPAAPTSAATSSAPPAPATTSAPAVTSEPGVVYEVVSTQTVTNGAQVQEIVWKEPVVYVTEDSVTTVTVPSAAAKERRLRGRHAWQHGHHGRRS